MDGDAATGGAVYHWTSDATADGDATTCSGATAGRMWHEPVTHALDVWSRSSAGRGRSPAWASADVHDAASAADST